MKTTSKNSSRHYRGNNVSDKRLERVGLSISNYDLARDGKRLAAIVGDPEGEKLPTHLTFLLNIFDELRLA